MKKRQIEVFSAGCPVCEEAIDLIKAIACPSCEVSYLRYARPECGCESRFIRDKESSICSD